MESRGFIFSAPLAYLLDAGLVPVRKLGKLPAETITVEYALEYGSNTLEIHRDAIQPGQRVLIVDDLLATGGTVKGTIELVERLRGEVVGPGLPRRARVPQGPRSARRPQGHQRHQVLAGTEQRIGGLARGRHARTGRIPDDGSTTPAGSTPTPLEPVPVDLGRRRFFRAVRRRAGPDGGDGRRRGPGPPARVRRGGGRHPRPRRRRRHARPSPTPTPEPGPPAGFRTPFREDNGALYLIDQRRLPDALIEVANRSAGEVAYAIREMVVRGAPAIGRSRRSAWRCRRERVRDARPYARRATLRGGANALINSRPTAVNLRWAVERVMARYEADRGSVRGRRRIADAMRAEADAIVFEATTDHGRLATFGLEILPVPADAPAAHPDPLQHGTARLRPVRDRPRRGPGGPPCRPPDPCLGRRDAPVPAGRAADGLGAGPGRRPAHAASPMWPPGT